MIELTNEQVKKINIRSNIDINGKTYYGKKSIEPGNELIACKLAQLVGIKCPKYLLAESSGKKYDLSEDIGANGLFLTAGEMEINSDSLYNIWAFLEEKFPNDKERLMFEIVKIYLFDIIVMNPDRNVGNYGFLFLDPKLNRISDVFILDNELIFDIQSSVILSSKFYDSNIKYSFPTDEEIEILENDMKKLEIFEGFSNEEFGELFSEIFMTMLELTNFLETSSEEFIELFITMWQTLSPDILKNVIDEVCQEEKIIIKQKHDYLKLYEANYEMIRKILENRGLINGKRIY